MSQTSVDSSIKMNLLIIVSVALVSGLDRSDQFKRHRATFVIPRVNSSSVKCALSCLTMESCLSFYMTKTGVCTSANNACQSRQDSICFNRKGPSGVRRTKPNVKKFNGKKKDNSKTMEQNRFIRKGLLLIPYNSKLPAKALDIQTLHDYPYNNLVFIRSVTFMYASFSLLFCTGTPPKIVKFQLPNGPTKTLKKADAFALSVDAWAKLIFVALRKGGVYRMSIKGGDLTLINSVKAHKLVVYRGVKALFVFYGYTIAKISYTGKRESAYKTGDSCRPLSLNLQKHLALCNEMDVLFFKRTDRNEATKIKLKCSPETVNIINGYMFYSCKNKSAVLMVKSSKEMDPIYWAKNGYKRVSHILFCFFKY